MNALPMPDWHSGYFNLSPLFAPMQAVGAELQAYAEWPDLAALQQLVAARIHPMLNVLGQPVRFVPQGEKPRCFEQEYEPRIYLTGEVQTRAENWHDLFNALAWLAFPRAKAALNARHYREVLREREAGQGRKRGNVRDRLTQFDESGVVILCADAGLAEMLDGHQWKTLFWDNRDRVGQSMRFLVFGHSLYEKALTPYPGLTGKSLLFPVGPEILSLSLEQQMALADKLLAELVNDETNFGAHIRLQPLPLLGVPGWAEENSVPAYYQDVRHFRPKRPSAPSPGGMAGG